MPRDAFDWMHGSSIDGSRTRISGKVNPPKLDTEGANWALNRAGSGRELDKNPSPRVSYCSHGLFRVRLAVARDLLAAHLPVHSCTGKANRLRRAAHSSARPAGAPQRVAWGGCDPGRPGSCSPFWSHWIPTWPGSGDAASPQRVRIGADSDCASEPRSDQGAHETTP